MIAKDHAAGFRTLAETDLTKAVQALFDQYGWTRDVETFLEKEGHKPCFDSVHLHVTTKPANDTEPARRLKVRLPSKVR